MGTTCLTVCPECSRHLRCGERACPFCGAGVASFLRVLEYRLKTQLSRGQAFSLGAALTAAGFVTSCDESVAPPYGLPCTPTTCSPTPASGGNGGSPVVAGGGGGVRPGGNAGSGGVAESGGTPSSAGGQAGAGDGGQATAGSMTGGAGETGGGDGGSSGATSENAGNGGAGGSR